MFETKIAILVDPDLEPWQKLNVTAFLATGISGAVPETMGEPYEDAAGRLHARLVGQPMMILAATPDVLRRAWGKSIERGLIRAGYVREMFSTGNDETNRQAFRAEPPDAPDLVGVALHGSRKDIDKVTKGAKLHQ